MTKTTCQIVAGARLGSHRCPADVFAVSWGLTYRELKDIKAIGVDEVQWQKGHK